MDTNYIKEPEASDEKRKREKAASDYQLAFNFLQAILDAVRLSSTLHKINGNKDIEKIRDRGDGLIASCLTHVKTIFYCHLNDDLNNIIETKRMTASPIIAKDQEMEIILQSLVSWIEEAGRSSGLKIRAPSDSDSLAH